MLGPVFLPFTGGPPPVTTQDDGADTRSKRRQEYVKPALHYVIFKGKTFEYSYSFASFRLKTLERDYRVAFSSDSHNFSDSYSTLYTKDRVSSVACTNEVITVAGFYHRKDFSDAPVENTFKDTAKAGFVLGMYDNRYEMEDAAILFHLSINL
jgi:hypothetical protein